MGCVRCQRCSIGGPSGSRRRSSRPPWPWRGWPPGCSPPRRARRCRRPSPAPSTPAPGFDPCWAPDNASMDAWLQSPYRAIGIYIGGLRYAPGCKPQNTANLTKQWVGRQAANGWRFLPLYVGSQAQYKDGQRHLPERLHDAHPGHRVPARLLRGRRRREPGPGPELPAGLSALRRHGELRLQLHPAGHLLLAGLDAGTAPQRLPRRLVLQLQQRHQGPVRGLRRQFAGRHRHRRVEQHEHHRRPEREAVAVGEPPAGAPDAGRPRRDATAASPSTSTPTGSTSARPAGARSSGWPGFDRDITAVLASVRTFDCHGCGNAGPRPGQGRGPQPRRHLRRRARRLGAGRAGRRPAAAHRVQGDEPEHAWTSCTGS